MCWMLVMIKMAVYVCFYLWVLMHHTTCLEPLSSKGIILCMNNSEQAKLALVLFQTTYQASHNLGMLMELYQNILLDTVTKVNTQFKVEEVKKMKFNQKVGFGST